VILDIDTIGIPGLVGGEAPTISAWRARSVLRHAWNDPCTPPWESAIPRDIDGVDRDADWLATGGLLEPPDTTPASNTAQVRSSRSGVVRVLGRRHEVDIAHGVAG